MMNLYGFSELISSEILIYSYSDFFLCNSFILSFILLNREKIKELKGAFSSLLSSKNKLFFLKLLSLLFLLIAISYSPKYVSLLLSGIGRQGLVDEVAGTPVLLSLATKYFMVLFIFSIFSGCDKTLKYLTFIGFVFTTVIMTSRANIMFAAYIYIIIKLIDLESGDIKKISLAILSTVIITIFFGVFVQSRETQSVFFGPFKPIEDLFLYNAYSLYLAKFSLAFAYDYEKLFYPFFGYASDFISSRFESDGIVDSNFVVGFHVFFSDIRQHSANVLYPWWSWFAGIYGFFGILLKQIFIYFLLFLSLKLRLFPILIIFLYWGLIIGFTKHPLMTLDSYFSLFFLLLLSLIPKIRFRKY